MTSHFPSFAINHWPGCAKAKLQAVMTADRKLCAAVTALASYFSTGKIYGTLQGKSADEIAGWSIEVCREHNVTPRNLECWMHSLNGTLFNASRAPVHLCGLGPGETDIDLDLYQTNTIAGLLAGGGAIGAFMGAGKTAMAASAAIGHILNERSEEEVPRPGRCWISCPLNAMPTWEKAKKHELSRYFAEVRIISIDSMHKYTSVADGDVLIVDEAHRAGSGAARRTKALHKIRSRFRFCVLLSGTFVHAGVAAALSIKDLAVPGLALFARTWTAGETFDCLVRKKLGARTVTSLEKPPSSTRPAFLEWLGLGVQLLTPDSKEVQSAFTLPGQELQELALNDPWPPLEEDVARVAHEVYAETGEFPHAQAVAHRLARDGIETKLDWLAGELAGIGSTPVVVFAQYRESLDKAESLIRGLGLAYVRVDGDVVGEDRSEVQRKFQDGEASVFLGQIHAASESMNLQVASISITLDVSWSCIDYSQALARTHRRGQNRPCLHIDLVSNRLQARILDRLRAGQDFANSCAEYQEIQRGLANCVLTSSSAS
jgi:hypothetical protein